MADYTYTHTINRVEEKILEQRYGQKEHFADWQFPFPEYISQTNVDICKYFHEYNYVNIINLM